MVFYAVVIMQVGLYTFLIIESNHNILAEIGLYTFKPLN